MLQLEVEVGSGGVTLVGEGKIHGGGREVQAGRWTARRAASPFVVGRTSGRAAAGWGGGGWVGDAAAAGWEGGKRRE